jgi:hypothetical protein
MSNNRTTKLRNQLTLYNIWQKRLEELNLEPPPSLEEKRMAVMQELEDIFFANG